MESEWFRVTYFIKDISTLTGALSPLTVFIYRRDVCQKAEIPLEML